MILIQSDSNDIATNAVINWLLHYNQVFFRFNREDVIGNVNYVDDGLSFTITSNITKKSKKIHLKYVKAYWYRRGFLIFSKPNISTKDTNDLSKAVDDYYEEEKFIITNLFCRKFDTVPKNVIGHEQFNYLSKIHVLNEAKKSGLNIPDTAIISSKKVLLEFNEKHKQNGLITKGINQSFAAYDNKSNISFTCFTTPFGLNEIKKCPDFFFPTLFQELIEKKFEIRIFFLKDKFYASAIFSQNDEKTKYDFRNYNTDKPNRTPPFNLPSDIKSKLKKLMQKLKLNSGSIDMIYSEHNQYIFLEVNPIGQFWQVSYPCNYYLEREIAKDLSKNH